MLTEEKVELSASSENGVQSDQLIDEILNESENDKRTISLVRSGTEV